MPPNGNRSTAASPEVYISVDVETAGPNPSTYSLLAIGACLVSDPERGFYVELQPVNQSAVPEALAISGLSLDELAERGLPPAEAMARFESWLQANLSNDRRPVLVAFNAPFDWMFINDYFHRFLGRNPFGHSALDIKALYMGLTGVRWSQTSMKHIAVYYLEGRELVHDALQDARDQAELFEYILADAVAQGPRAADR